MSEARPVRRPPAVPGALLWSFAQWIGVAATAGLLLALIRVPDVALDLLWYAVIPLLPATFLVSTQIWRNLCPLATLNTLTGNRFGERRLAGRWIRYAGVVGVALLFLLVPARRFFFNVDAPVLAVTIAVVAVLALIGGFFLDKKAAFCNAVCPVLPVERLYGQRPLVSVPNARCAPCRRCTMGNCIDLVPERAAVGMLGAREKVRLWFLNGYGTFALAFPGFVVGYSLLPDGGVESIGLVYGTVALWAAMSWTLLAGLFAVFRIDAAVGLLWCAALAAGLYYWFAPPAIMDTFQLPGAFSPTIRLVGIGLVGAWLLKALQPRFVTAQSGRRTSS